MAKFTIFNKEYVFIDNINDLTLSQYQKIMALKYTDIDDYMVNIISVLINIPVDELYNIDIHSYNKIVDHLKIILKQNLVFEKSNSIKIGENTYKIVEKSEFTVSHWIDTQFYCTDEYGNNTVEKNIHKIIAIMLLKKSDIESIEELSEKLLHCKITEIYGLFEYYLEKKKKFWKSTQCFFKMVFRKMVKKVKILMKK